MVNYLVDSKRIISETLQEYIPKEVNTELVFNKEIEYSSNGKFKLFIDKSNSKSF